MSDLPTPNDRVESLLMAILTGDGSDLPTPRTRTEKLLMAIYENGGTGGGGTGGVTPAQVKTILLANTDTALNGASSNPIANKALVAALADYVKSADLSIPTKVSELTNDKKYQTDSDLVTALTPYAKSNDVTAEIIAEIAKVVANAPESFDTLKEMSDWIAHHESDATTMNSAISDNKNAIDALQSSKANKSEIPDVSEYITEEQLIAKDYADKAYVTEEITKISTGGEINLSSYLSKVEAAETYVIKESGKSLIDDTEIERLASVSNYDDTNIRAELANKADITAIPTVDVTKSYVDTELLKKADTDHTHTTVNGHTVESDVPVDAKFTDTVYDDTNIKTEIAKKADTTSIPSKVSDLENDSKYQTESNVATTLTNYATKTYVGEQITNAEHLKREIVTVLPLDTEASDNIIYMLKVESATGDDKYQEYMKIDGTVKMVGDTSVDLTDYVKKNEIPTTVAELTDSADYAKTADIPKSLPANGGNADTVNNHNVETNVPANAVFTDTIYDDTEVKERIVELDTAVNGNKTLIDTIVADLTASDNTKFRFATDGEGNYGFLKADDSFVPFKKGGSGGNVTIDGVPFEGDVLNLVSETIYTQVSTLPYNFYLGSAVVFNNEIHILGGYENQLAHYKFNGNSWTQVSTLPYNFYLGSAVVFNNEIHILGGYENQLAHYKFNGNSWTQVSTLPYNFYLGSAVVFNNEIHILGGYENQLAHYKFNGNSWTQVSTLPYNFYLGSAVVFNNEIHILGGYENQLAHYKFNGNTWTSVSELPYNFYDGSAIVLDDQIHIIGGRNDNALTKHYILYNNKWIQVSILPYTYYNGVAVSFNNKIHLMGTSGNYKYYKNHYSIDKTRYYTA